MKRFLILGALVVAFGCSSVQEASAWINSNFGLGMNWNWQSGGNSIGCGLWRDGQPCGPDLIPTHTPVYGRPCCCQANVVTVQPQVFCPPGAAQAPCPGLGGAPPMAGPMGGPYGGPVGPMGGPVAGPVGAPVGAPAGPAQAFRYSYRPATPYYYGR